MQCLLIHTLIVKGKNRHEQNKQFATQVQITDPYPQTVSYSVLLCTQRQMQQITTQPVVNTSYVPVCSKTV